MTYPMLRDAPGTEVSTEEPSVPVAFRVSSRHLILASTVFKAAFTGRWREGTRTPEGYLVIEAEDWDAAAMLIAMNIVYGHLRQVDVDVSLEELAKLAVLVDYYGLHDALWLHTTIWIKKLQQSLPTAYNRELRLWMCIAWVFKDADIFKKVTAIAVQHHTSPLTTLGLPIPSTIISKSGP
ncbi:hypothetical protein VTK56DRAFT_8527 [Thermocarpiscus australiensis]